LQSTTDIGYAADWPQSTSDSYPYVLAPLSQFPRSRSNRSTLDKAGTILVAASTMSEEEKEQTVHEEDDQGNILAYPAWNKKNAPKDNQDKWEVPIYL